MDDLEKSAIRIRHWIDHNKEHLAGYKQVADLLKEKGQAESAAHIQTAIEFAEKANAAFSASLQHLPDSNPQAGKHDEHHHHHHHGEHSHKHD
jgi:hypothetical protein